jgi:hypothetical protein
VGRCRVVGQFDCGGLLGLENGRVGEHIRRMAKAPDKIRFDPLPHKVGEDWYILAKYPDGQQEHITGFKSVGEAMSWMGSPDCKEWLKARGHQS